MVLARFNSVKMRSHFFLWDGTRDSGPKSGFREVTGLRVQESFEHGFRESARRLAEVIVDDISN